MSCIEILQGTPTWVPFIAADVGTGDPRTSILFNQVDVSFKKSTDPTFQVKALTGPPTDYRENGNGVYEILFSGTDLDTLGTFLYVVNSNGALPAPAIRQFVGQAFIESSATYTPGTISLSTNIVTGNLIDLNGNALADEAVSARVMSAPTVLGTSPNIGGIGTDIVSAQTDSGGFFALELLQGAVVDIVIPSTGYRRTLTVPANSTDVLFDIP
jgi:hypothetical protein